MQRIVFLCSLTLFFVFAMRSVQATEACTHPADSVAAFLPSRQIDTTVNASTATSEVRTSICVFRNAQSQISTAIQITPISITGSADDVDTVPTSTILSRLRVRSVVLMISDGEITCTTSPDTMRVYHPISIIRSGSGSSTTFATASESLIGYYDYQYRYPNSNSIYPEVTLVGSGTVGATQLQ